jgi:hypothetical protein
LLLAYVVNAANPRVVIAYILARALALDVSLTAKTWARAMKWVWVALSLAMIFAIVSGPLDYLRLG